MDAAIAQTCEEIRDAKGRVVAWRWTLSLSTGGQRNRVARVIYRLHPGLATPVRTATDPQTAFAIRLTAWGGFKVAARVVWQDGSEKRIEAQLCLPDGRTAAPSIDEPASKNAEGYYALGQRFLDQDAFKQAREAFEKAAACMEGGVRATPPEAALDAALINEKRAVCTYKDAALPEDERLDEALALLGGQEGLRAIDLPNRLGVAGAIFKRKWELDSKRTHLETSLHYYRRGHEAAIALPAGDTRDDTGYTTINAAFILDLLAHAEEADAAEAGVQGSGDARRAAAADLRRSVIARLEPQPPGAPWWVRATLAEAYLGLGPLDKVREQMTAALQLPDVPAWYKESTAMQMAAVIRCARWSDAQRAGAWTVFRALFGRGAQSRAQLGKVGLALSGGGFRASLFHIGVLARLAELDLLRHVDVLSCVSGGSIVGAHYYLLLRELLQRLPDEEIGPAHYRKLVRTLAAQFLAGVQKNIRTRVILDPVFNAKMIVAGRRYSRTSRLAELYERHLYSQVDDGEQGHPRYINDLFVQPRGADHRPDDTFSPKLNNWMRDAKVPVLVLNAATLNTGHGWQFTASWMGEPPSGVEGDLDANERLRRVYYEDAPAEHQRMRLGKAVAASSCVPGLFDPLPLPGLYPDRVVRLVDGGTRDNQGVESLFDQGCRIVIVSDATGQMDSEADPQRGIFSVLMRSQALLETQVRTGQYRDLGMRHKAGTLRRPVVVHLKQGLDVEAIGWLGAPAAGTAPPESETAYGIAKSAQRKLAALRTDLDSFTEVEAFALMTSGYKMAAHQLARGPFAPVLTGPAPEPEPWPFLAIEPALRHAAAGTPPEENMQRQLRVGAKQAFKVFHLYRPLQALTALVGLALLATAVRWAVPALSNRWGAPVVRVPTVGAAVAAGLSLLAGAAVAALLGRVWTRILRFNQTVRDLAIAVAASVVLSLLAAIHLLVFDRLFRWQGRLQRLQIPAPGVGRQPGPPLVSSPGTLAVPSTPAAPPAA